MSRNALFRIIAVLLLLIAGAEAYACDVSDACVSPTGQNGQDDSCDQPLGDNCLCCCHHVVPVTPFHLEAAGSLIEAAPLEPVAHTARISLPIDHPPQL